jgi:hypothetical protein
MDLLLEIIIWGAILWLASKFILFYVQAKNEVLKEELDKLTKQLNDKIIHVKVEKHGSVFYLFEKDTHRFIAQGSDLNEVKKKCLYEMFDWDLEDSGGEVESRRCECFIASDADFVSQMLKNSADGDSNTAKANKFSEVYAFKLKMSIFVSIKVKISNIKNKKFVFF